MSDGLQIIEVGGEANTCRTCKHFQPNDDSSLPNYPYRGWGRCDRLTDGYDYEQESDGPADGRLAIPWDHEGYSAGLYVSPRFGCVHWELGG